MTGGYAVNNTDRELWREREGDFYADSIFVTKEGAIGIKCGGFVIIRPLREWHALALADVAKLPVSFIAEQLSAPSAAVHLRAEPSGPKRAEDSRPVTVGLKAKYERS